MYKCSLFDKISFILVIIGAIVLGVFGVSECNLIHLLFGNIVPILERAVYILIGLSGLNLLFFIIKTKR